ncbi:PEP-CTERM sorting domain-containing protein [Pelomonas sp. KK5]|uniref:PEP-CTERM sorting domain-containing protein n=1 Tax=Pelomonas sp. KK5 TaxID=1855730 RepID=UPI00097BE10E|nr:PEP-CTERM sorting domain-containing protein [Pelomonas sp. KK5]
MKNKQYLCALLVAGASGAALAQTNLVANGGFESPTVANNSYGTFQTISGWTLNSEIEIRDNRVGTAAEGKNFAELDTDVANNGNGKNNTISQTIATVVGATYTFSFQYSNRPFESVANPVSVPASSSGLHYVIGDLNGDAPAMATITDDKNHWTTFTTTFVATSTSTLLSFAALGTVDGFGSSLDDVRVVMTSPVPEPESYALMLAGLGAVAFVARRRPRR